MVPKVSTQIWYNVGSKDEKSGEKGLAHLLEHMIFKGTSKLTESDINLITHKLSGSCNAFTSYDYTGYLFDFPTQNWKQAFEMFADCMSNCTFKKDLLASEMKAVIQELKMYRDDYNSSIVEEMISSIFYDHPYHNPIIGYKQDLWEITSENLMAFYKKHYLPNNATIVVVGDVDPQEVFDQAEKSFGKIPSNTDYKKEKYYHNRDLIAKSVTINRDIAQPMVMLAWTIPGASAKMDYLIDILSWILGTGKSSRLFKKIVDELHLATDVSTFAYDLFDHGLFFIVFQPKEQDKIEEIISVINQVISDIIEHGITAEELVRATKKAESDYISLLENNEKQAYVIGKTYLATGNENYLFEYLDYPKNNLDKELVAFLKRYIRPAVMHRGVVLPLQDTEKQHWAEIQQESDIEDARILAQHIRDTPVEPGDHVHTIQAAQQKPFSFPKAQKATLSNGLEVLYFDNPNVPKIDIVIEFKARSYFDPKDKQGLFNFMNRMFIEGTKNYPGHALADELAKYGMSLGITPGFISMSVQTADLKHGLDILKDVFTNVIFDPQNVEKIRKSIIADIKNYWDNPSEFSGQLIRDAIYKDHPYAQSLLGTIESVNKITRDELIEAYQQWVTPKQTGIALVGDLNDYDIPKITEQAFGDWDGPEVASIDFPKLAPITSREITYPINRDQVTLGFAGSSVSRFDDDYDKLLVFDQIFSGGALGSMSSRLFGLRERSGLFYTIRGSLISRATEQPGMVLVKTIVSTDRLDEAQKAIAHEINTAADNISPQELEDACNAISNSLIDNFATNRNIAGAFLFLRRYKLPDDHFDKRAQKLCLIDAEAVKKAANKVLDTNKMITVKVGRV